MEDQHISIEESDDLISDEKGFQTLDQLIQTTKKQDFKEVQKPEEKPEPKSKTVQRLEVVDDFIRNYLIKNKMTKSLEIF